MTDSNQSIPSNEPKKYYGHELFYVIMEELKELHSRKNHDYAGENSNPLGNFIRVSNVISKLLNPNIPEKYRPAVVALIYAMKQVDAVIDSLGSGRELKVDGLEERLRDVSVYSILAQIMVREAEDK